MVSFLNICSSYFIVVIKILCDFFWIHRTSGNVVNYITALYQEPQHMHPNKAKIEDLDAFRLVAFNLRYLPAGDKNNYKARNNTTCAGSCKGNPNVRRTYQPGGLCGASWWLVILLLLLILFVINFSLLIMLVCHE